MKRRGAVLLAIVLLISLMGAQYLFTVEVKVMPKFIPAGGDIIVSTEIKSLGISSDRVDIKVSYEIVSRDGELINKSERIIDIQSSTMAIQTSLSISEIFTLSEDIKPGNYKMVVSVDYEGRETSGSDSFHVTKNTILNKLNKLINNNQVILVILALLILIASIWRIIQFRHRYHKKNKARR